MRTVGVDLSAQSKETAVATIDWQSGGAAITSIVVGADDNRIVNLASGVAMIGIDSPFGWPSSFVDFVVSYRARQSHATRLDSVEHRGPLLVRQNDLHVKA